MKAKTLISFYDLKAGVDRKPGDEFECTEARFNEIIEANQLPLVEKVATATRKRTTKKTAAKAQAEAEESEAKE